MSLPPSLTNKTMENVHTKSAVEENVFRLISILDYTVIRMFEDDNSDYYESLRPHNYLLSFSNVYTLKQKSRDYINMLTNIIKERQLNKVSVDAQIKDYIDENYQNANLSATLISEKFGIQPVALSVLFKKSFHIGMSDYITKLRIKKAKELLSSTSETLESIAQSVGYTNVRSFFRAFKKIENITPGQYRNQ